MKRAALALVVVSACASSTPKVVGRSVQWDTTDRRAPQTRLEKFSAALARAGMSVPVPARVCMVDDGVYVSEEHARFDDVNGCIVLANGDGPRKVRDSRSEASAREAILAYAIAITKARLPPVEWETRATELADAYLANDDAKLAMVAREVENEFDALRLKRPSRVAHREPPRRVEGESTHAPPVSEIADAGPAAAASASERRDEPKRAEHVELVDGGPVVASTKDKLVGTWAYDGGPIRNIYAMCADGKYEVTFEVVDSSFEMAPDELPTVHGTWIYVDGDPPKITFSALGETMDAPLIKIEDDDIDITLDNENLHLTRRSKSASCD